MSTYLIDCSKKCLIGGTKASLKGDLTEGSLQGIGLGFKENFMQAAEKVDKEFEKLMKPVKTMVQGLLSAIPILKGLNIQGDGSSIRDTLINAYTLYSVFMGEDPTSTLGKWNKVYITNAPLRKAPPNLSLKSGGITIEFAYGKCNLFDAYYEVFQPLMALQNSIFPRVATGEVALNSSIHYPQEVFPKLIMKAANNTKNSVFKNLKGMKDLANSLKSTFNTTLIKRKLKNKISSAFSTSKIKTVGDYISNKTKVENSFGIIALPNTKALIGSLDPELFIKESISISMPGEEAQDNQLEETTDKKELDISKMVDEVYDSLSSEIDSIYEEGSILVEAGGVYSKKDSKDEKDSATHSNTMGTIFSNLVNLEYNLKSNILAELMPKGAGTSIALGFPAIYYTAQKDVETTCTFTAGKVHYYSVIIEAANITFDFSRVDEAGYPMAGKLVIERLWNLYSPNYTLGIGSSIDGSTMTRQVASTVDETSSFETTSTVASTPTTETSSTEATNSTGA